MKTICYLPHQLFANTAAFLIVIAIYAWVAAQKGFATFALAVTAATAIAFAASTKPSSASSNGYATLSSLTARTSRPRGLLRQHRGSQAPWLRWVLPNQLTRVKGGYDSGETTAAPYKARASTATRSPTSRQDRLTASGSVASAILSFLTQASV